MQDNEGQTHHVPQLQATFDCVESALPLNGTVADDVFSRRCDGKMERWWRKRILCEPTRDTSNK